MSIQIGRSAPIRLNICVSGESGNGKTTFCYSILKKYVNSAKERDFYSRQTRQTVRIEEVGKFELKADNGETTLIVSFFDTRGYGDFVNNKDAVDNVKNFITGKHQAWLSIKGQEFSDEERNNEDERIHLLFYFLAPHRFKQIDPIFLEELADVVNIVLVVAKSDTMTVEERRNYLQEIRSMLKELRTQKNVTIYDFKEELEEIPDEEESDRQMGEQTDEGSSTESKTEDNNVGANTATSVTEEAGDGIIVGDSNLPPLPIHQPAVLQPPAKSKALPMIKNVFAICCANQTGLREFPWGTINTEDPTHSDFPRLRALIFEKGHINELRRKTQELSNKWNEKLKQMMKIQEMENETKKHPIFGDFYDLFTLSVNVFLALGILSIIVCSLISSFK